VGKKLPVIEEITLDNLGYAKSEVPVGDRFEDFLAQPLAKFYHPLLMTRWTEVPSLAGKCKQVLMPAFTTPYPCKTVMKDAAIEVAVYNVFHIGAEKAILLCEPIIIDLFQRLKLVFNALIILRRLRIARSVNSRGFSHRLPLNIR